MVIKLRRTKIIATLGPASDSYEIIKGLVREGADGFRLNFSHGTHEEKAHKIEIVRRIEEEIGKFIPIIADLQGPSIRLGQFKGFNLRVGEKVKLVYKNETDKEGEIPIFSERFFKIVELGDTVFIDDGRISLKVTDVKEEYVECEVEIGGSIRSRVTVHIQGKEFDLPALTEKDRKDLEFILEKDIDIVFQSFVRNKKDILELRKIIEKYGREDIRIYAKIETRSGMENIDEILEVSDGILIARGDLGMYFPLEEIPILEASLARKALEHGKPVILATQLLESMIKNPIPTRAEVVDIFNGVYHCVDAMMLSGETAIGSNPILAVRWLRKVIERAEKKIEPIKINGINETAYDKFAKGIVYLAESLDAKILAYTKKGSTARRLARYRPKVVTYVATEDKRVARQISILWGITPIQFAIDLGKSPISTLLEEYRMRGLVSKGDIAVVTIGLREGATDLAHVEIIQ